MFRKIISNMKVQMDDRKKKLHSNIKGLLGSVNETKQKILHPQVPNLVFSDLKFK